MALLNTKERFGWMMKLLHWGVFVLFAAQFFLINRREYLPEDAPEKLQYILLHKANGMVLLGLAVFMIVWRQLGQRPAMPAHMSAAHTALAKLMHLGLYTVMLLMPISGYLMSTFSGYSVSLFGWFNMPMLVGVNKEYAMLAKDTHAVLAITILVLVSLHALAALAHHFYYKNDVLKRML